MPWHQRGIRVGKFVYRIWYVLMLGLALFFLLSTLSAAFIGFAQPTPARELIFVAAAVVALPGFGLLWLAIHRLRRPVEAPQ